MRYLPSAGVLPSINLHSLLLPWKIYTVWSSGGAGARWSAHWMEMKGPLGGSAVFLDSASVKPCGLPC
jgi:hypothetical protein